MYAERMRRRNGGGRFENSSIFDPIWNVDALTLAPHLIVILACQINQPPGSCLNAPE